MPIATKRSRPSGTFTRAKRSSPASGSRTRRPRLSDSPEMYGNGWPGPTASGVSTGKIWRANTCSSSVALCLGRRPRRRRRGSPRRRARDRARRARAPTAAPSARARCLVISASVCCGVRPSGERTESPESDLVLQAGDAHHEELVEDRRDDPAELDPLEQRLVRVGRELEHAPHQVELRQLAVQSSVS